MGAPYIYDISLLRVNIEVLTRCICYRVYFIWRLLYMFRLSLLPFVRSTNNCNCSIW